MLPNPAAASARDFKPLPHRSGCSFHNSELLLDGLSELPDVLVDCLLQFLGDCLGSACGAVWGWRRGDSHLMSDPKGVYKQQSWVEASE